MTRFTRIFVFGQFVAIFLSLLISVPLEAQTGSIRLEGTVRDPSGNPLADSTLTAVEENTGRQSQAVSNSNGHYWFPALPPGIYTVTATSKGFKDVVHRGIHLFSPGSAIENLSFEVSAIEKEIGPEQRPGVNESATSTSFSQRRIDALPLLNRDPLALLVYQPGIQINGGTEGISTINGTRSTMNTIGMDGLSITDPTDPSLGSSLLSLKPYSISDMQMITTGGYAEYGRSGGGQTVLLSSPGKKSWSGNFYDYFRDRNLNANEFFNNKYGIPRPQYSRNIFGATASGHIGTKTLAFVNFEGSRTNQRVIRERLVLTDVAKTGVFRWYTPDDSVRDETTVKSYDIVANDPRGIGIDPTVSSMIARLPNPNNFAIGDGLNTGGFGFDSPFYADREGIVARLDYNLSNKDRLFFRLDWDHVNATDITSNADASFPGETSGTHDEHNWGFSAGWDYRASPNLINELRGEYLLPKTELNRPARTTEPMLLANSWTDPLDPSFPLSFRSSILELTDIVTYGRARHSLKFGFTFRRTLQHNTDYSGVYPDVTFGTGNGNAPSSSIGPSEQSEISSADRQTFEKLYNDLLGRMESVSQIFYSGLTSTLPVGTARDRKFTSMDFSGFIQDSWRILPNLTLNLGLRYEQSTAPKEQNGFQEALDRTSEISDSANISDFSIVPGNKWYARSATDFAPRAGFAWDIFGSGTMVLRGAYGLYYDRLIGGITSFIDKNSYGFSQSVSLYPNAAGTDARLSDGIPTPSQPGPPDLQPLPTRSSSIAVLDPDLRTPRVDQFSLKLEKRLFGAILEAGYVGTRGRDLFQYSNLNQTKTNGDFLEAFRQLQEYRTAGTPVPPSNTLIRIFGTPLAVFDALGGTTFDRGEAGIAADTLDRNYFGNYAAAGLSDFYIRNFPQFDQFMFGTNTAKSWYDSLQVGIRKSTNHYDLAAYYTWSKSLDTMSASGTEFVSPADSFHPKNDKAPSDFARTHVLNIAWNYELPFGSNRLPDLEIPKWADFAFGGWRLGTLWIWESGARFSVNSGLQNLYAGVDSLANYSGSTDIGKITHFNNVVFWFDPVSAALFSSPDAGEIPSSGRNAFTGPRYFNLDLVLHKEFPIGETHSLEFRFETFNLLNNTRFAIPNNNLGNPNFGIITSTTGNPRILQVALRYQF